MVVAEWGVGGGRARCSEREHLSSRRLLPESKSAMVLCLCLSLSDYRNMILFICLFGVSCFKNKVD